MKLVKAYVHHVRTAAVVQHLADAGYRNLALLDVRGTLKAFSDDERDYSFSGASLIGEIQLELVCEDSEVDAATSIIRTLGRIGSQVCGWVYVSPIDLALPIGGESIGVSAG